MLKTAGTIFLALLVLLIGYGLFRQYQQEEERGFREGVLVELSKLDSVRSRGDPSDGDTKRLVDSYSQRIIRGEEIADRERRQYLYLLRVTACETEVKWRTGLASLEKKIKDRYDGVLPLWVTQDRNWQRMNDLVKRGDFKIPTEQCSEYATLQMPLYLEGPKEKSRREIKKEPHSEQAPPGQLRETLIQSALERVKNRAESGPKQQKREAVSSGPAEGEGAASIGSGGKGGGIVKGVDFIVYRNQMLRLIRERWNWVGKRSDLEVTVRFGIQENGQILDLKVVRSSGDSSYDDSIITAVRRTSPMPPPPESYRKDFMDVELTFRPKDLGG